MNNLDDIITPTLSWLKEKNKVAIATVISTWGSAPRPVSYTHLTLPTSSWV